MHSSSIWLNGLILYSPESCHAPPPHMSSCRIFPFFPSDGKLSYSLRIKSGLYFNEQRSATAGSVGKDVRINGRRKCESSQANDSKEWQTAKWRWTFPRFFVWLISYVTLHHCSLLFSFCYSTSRVLHSPSLSPYPMLDRPPRNEIMRVTRKLRRQEFFYSSFSFILLFS